MSRVVSFPYCHSTTVTNYPVILIDGEVTVSGRASEWSLEYDPSIDHNTSCMLISMVL